MLQQPAVCAGSSADGVVSVGADAGIGAGVLHFCVHPKLQVHKKK